MPAGAAASTGHPYSQSSCLYLQPSPLGHLPWFHLMQSPLSLHPSNCSLDSLRCEGVDDEVAGP